ncbi:MAG TPA: beta-N-acetylhexosaminidase [Verrucomicrobiae bacterium]|nr:beta-N-acetylhexosaminidase [Verrucomicrobiae bacterium]
MKCPSLIKMKNYNIIVMLCCFFISATVLASEISAPALIPVPENMECHKGWFKFLPNTKILVDQASKETGQYLVDQIRKPTGYPFEVSSLDEASTVKGSIMLTTRDANTNLGAEGYELDVSSDSVVIRAPTQAGLFYGVQTLLQLLPPEIFSTNAVTNVDWMMPCVQIKDQPRFKWRGLMLDVSRHFFTKEEIEQLLDAMVTLKMNVFHWHLTDDQGWRIEIEKYPKLTQIGAWRPGVGFGLDPKSTTAYGTDGRYGGFYTPEDIREVVKYAAARHIMIVPEIEMPGHSMAALAAYPQFSCTGGSFTIPLELGIFNSIYNPANEATFKFLDDVLTEVFQLFPGKYIHLGGDEVPKDTWKDSPACQALMKREGLTDEDQLQGWFMQRMEKFAEAHGRIPIGWSEIMQGGLVQNTAVMDWIGGGVEAVNSGHDVVMTPTKFCYFCYYPSLDRPPNLRAYRPYLPLNQVYAFEPIPATLKPQYRSHILGVEACIWTPDIPSMSDVEELTFPRANALAEVGWSPKSAHNFDDFSHRLNVEYQRLAFCGINYWRDNATQIGGWNPSQIIGKNNQLGWDATREITAPGRYRLSLNYTEGQNGLNIKWAALLEDGHEIVRDVHAGFTGTTSEAVKARDWNYYLDLPTFKKGAKYAIQVSVTGEGGNDSRGVVFLGRELAK